MVSFEISFIDIILMIAITMLITLYVTLLIRLKPSSETAIDEYIKKQRKRQATYTETATKPSKPMTIAEAIQMHQTSTATVETSKEPEMLKTTKTPKAPVVYIENQRDIEHKREAPETPEKIEAPKTEERQPPTPPPIQTPPSPTQSGDMDLAHSRASSECAHHFGYLRTLPRNTPIPDECFGCTRIMECFMQS